MLLPKENVIVKKYPILKVRQNIKTNNFIRMEDKPATTDTKDDKEVTNRGHNSVEQESEDTTDPPDINMPDEPEQCLSGSSQSKITDSVFVNFASHNSSSCSSSSSSSSVTSFPSTLESFLHVFDDASHVAGPFRAYNDDNYNNNNNFIITTCSYDNSSSYSDDSEQSPEVDKAPSVCSKILPPQKFFFPRELMNRQIRGDDPKRKHCSRFESQAYSAHSMIRHLGLYHEYEKHRGSVNTLSFNDGGEVLVSGSNDQHVCLWDWSQKKELLYFPTGHTANVLKAKYLPYTNDTRMITCAADAEVRLCLLDSCGLKRSQSIVSHDYIAYDIAIQRQIPNTFLSVGEDGVVYSIDVREAEPCVHKLLTVMESKIRPDRTMSLFSVHCNPLKNHEFIVCGEDKDVRMYDQRKISPNCTGPVKLFRPTEMKRSQSETGYVSVKKCDSFKALKMTRCSCAMFNYNGTEVLASYSHNDIYLFDAVSGDEVHRYNGHRNIRTDKGVHFYGPRSEYVVSGSDCGFVYFWDKNSEAIVQWIRRDSSIVHCVEPHPVFPVIATSGIESSVKVWMPHVHDCVKYTELEDNELSGRIPRRKAHLDYFTSNHFGFVGRSTI